MSKRTERARLLKKLRREFESVGREDVKTMSPARFYRFILKQERLERKTFFAEPRTPVEFMSRLVFSINRTNAERSEYARGNPNWSR